MQYYATPLYVGKPLGGLSPEVNLEACLDATIGSPLPRPGR